jgi:hypothetical protein
VFVLGFARDFVFHKLDTVIDEFHALGTFVLDRTWRGGGRDGGVEGWRDGGMEGWAME